MLNIGDKIGRWTIIEKAAAAERGKTRWLCRCECGTEKIIRQSVLKQGGSRSCGCIFKDAHPRRVRPIVAGEKFGLLTVIERSGFSKDCYGRNEATVLCKCDCGNIVNFVFNRLTHKKTNSCGCYNKSRLKDLTNPGTHNLSKHPLFRIWADIKTRCFNKKRKAYKNYGGRGITICDEWKSNFVTFYNWAIENGWVAGLEIDRRNNDGNYEPNNCRFVTSLVNNNNRRNNIIVEYKGEKMTLPNACRLLGFNRRQYVKVFKRIKSWNCSFEDAVFRPKRKYRDSKI